MIGLYIQMDVPYLNLDSRDEQTVSLINKVIAYMARESQVQLNPPNDRLSKKCRVYIREIRIQLRQQVKRLLRSEHCGAIETAKLGKKKVGDALAKMETIHRLCMYSHFEKKQDILEADVAKFLYYKRTEQPFLTKLHGFLSSPQVFQFLFQEYMLSFNPNLYISDLIRCFYFLCENGMLKQPVQECFTIVRNADLVRIEKKNIIFRELCNINEKYRELYGQLGRAYISLAYIRPSKLVEDEEATQKKTEEREVTIQVKSDVLRSICRKLKKFEQGMDINIPKIKNATEIVLLTQDIGVFTTLNSQYSYLERGSEDYLHFLLDLFDPEEQVKEETVGESNFPLLRAMIIKVEALKLFNRIISALNLGSHIANQLNSDIDFKEHSFVFTDIPQLIRRQFNPRRGQIYQSSPSNPESSSFFKSFNIQSEEGSYIIYCEDKKVIYPSAINAFLCFLRYMLDLSGILSRKGIFQEEFVLQLLQIRANQICDWVEAIHNCYQIIKGKYPGCNPLVSELILITLVPEYNFELQYIEKLLPKCSKETLFVHFIQRQKKANCFGQIIFELDASQDIQPSLAQLLSIERTHQRQFYFTWSVPQFYEIILNEIIETKNNLKFDRCLSFSTLHSSFGFFTNEAESFQQILDELVPLCLNRLRITELIRFFHGQLRLKRLTFEAEFFWVTILNKDVKNKLLLASTKKNSTFKDYFEETTKAIRSFNDFSLERMLDSIENFQRAINIYEEEISRAKLIQSIIHFTAQYPQSPPNMENYIFGLNLNELHQIFQCLSKKNLVQDVFAKKETQLATYIEMKNSINLFGKVKFNQLQMTSAAASEKIVLSDMVYLSFAFLHSYNLIDCHNLIVKVCGFKIAPDSVLKGTILRDRKQIVRAYEQSCFEEASLIQIAVQFYEMLFEVVFLRILQIGDLSECDRKLVIQLTQQLPAYRRIAILRDFKSSKEINEKLFFSDSTRVLLRVQAILENYERNFRNEYAGQNWTFCMVCLIARLSTVGKSLVHTKMMDVLYRVFDHDFRINENIKAVHTQRIQGMLKEHFLKDLNQMLVHIPYKIDPSAKPKAQLQMLKKEILRRFILDHNQKHQFIKAHAVPIILFDEHRGYEVEPLPYHHLGLFAKKQRNRYKNKKGILKTFSKNEVAQAIEIIRQMRNKVHLDIIRASLPMRKLIYKLQLEDKKIRNQIVWETCRLEHAVISKIHAFIQESNLDQQQSLINFKYTVHLETKKGIENVIKERTEMYVKSNQEWIHRDDEQGLFLTDARQLEEQDALLSSNVRNLFDHLKKIKIFSEWKKLHFQQEESRDEWERFRTNVAMILHNSENHSTITAIGKMCGNYFKEEVICNLIKEENGRINYEIRQMKITTLSKKLIEFREKHGNFGRPKQIESIQIDK